MSSTLGRRCRTFTLALLLASVPFSSALAVSAKSKTTRPRTKQKVARKLPSESETLISTVHYLFKPLNSYHRLSDIGRGKAVVYSPDMASPGNRRFYERLGFRYFEEPSWSDVLIQIRTHNFVHRENPITTVILETHGTNGTGLRLQAGKHPEDARSYISMGGLQEKLEDAGVQYAIIAACNAGRLYRPWIYNDLDTDPGDPLFMPATLGVIDASDDFHPDESPVVMIRRSDSHLETTLEASTDEFSEVAQQVFAKRRPRITNAGFELHREPITFAVSSMLMQLVLRDTGLKLACSGYDIEKSRDDLAIDTSEQLLRRFEDAIDQVAEREQERRFPAIRAAESTEPAASPSGLR